MKGSCLNIVVARFQTYLVADLLKKGADPNAKDMNGNASLHYLFMIFNKNPAEARRIGQLLLEYHADPNLENEDGWSPIHLATNKQQT